MAKKITRRQFFRLGLLDALDLMKDSTAPNRAKKTPSLIRPPGAIKDDEVFSSTCGRCGKCSEACPYDAIFHLGPAAGADEETPVMDPNKAPCRWCPTMDCINACPSGALSFNEDDAVDPIGKAVLDLNLCLTQQGILCDDCVTVCPSNIKAIKIVNRTPQIDQDKCVGCGLCVYYCAASPVAISILPHHSYETRHLKRPKF